MKRHFDSLYGEVNKNLTSGEFTLTETEYPSDFELSKHAHPFSYFCFVLKGNFVEINEKKSHSCSASTLIYRPSENSHSDYFQTKVRCFNLQMSNKWINLINCKSLFTNSPAYFRGGYLGQLMAKIYLEFCKFDELSSIIIEGLVLEALGQASRQTAKCHSRKKIPHWLVQVRELLHGQFDEGLSLSEIAKTVGVHETHLSREFYRHFDCTIGEYVRRLRIEFACCQLSTSQIPLKEIAVSAGFFDQSHFGKIFKRLTGMSPATYRKMFSVR